MTWAAAPEPAAPANGIRVAETLTLPYALDIAWTSNPRVREAQALLAAAGHEVVGAYGGFLPTLNITANRGEGAVSAVEATLPIWQGGLTLAQISTANAREVIAEAGVARARLQVGNETLLAFYNLVQAQEQLAQWKRYLDALARLQETIENRAREGVAPGADVQTATSRVRQAEVGQEAASLQLAASRNELARLLRIWPRVAQVDATLSPELLALFNVPVAQQVDQHPDVLIAAAQVKEQKGVVDQAFAQLSPQFAVQYRHYYGGEEFVSDPTADEPQLVTQMPLGGTFANVQRTRSEVEKMESARQRLDTARRDVETSLRQTREQLSSASRQFRLQAEAASTSQALVQSFLRQYQVGRRSWVEVLNAQREAHEVELGLIAARRAYLLSGRQLALQSMAWNLLAPAR